MKISEDEKMIDYKRAFKIACELLNGTILYGVDKDSIFETIMNEDGIVDNESYENYILSHMDELDRGNGMTREEAIKIFKDKIKTMEHGAICCNFGIDKDAFLLAIQALEQEPCKDAISRKAVLDIVRDMHDLARADVLSYTINQIEKLSPINQEPKIGHWIKEKSLHGWDGKSYQCSVCGRSIHIDPEAEDLTDYPYCHCGAIMTESEE